MFWTVRIDGVDRELRISMDGALWYSDGGQVIVANSGAAHDWIDANVRSKTLRSTLKRHCPRDIPHRKGTAIDGVTKPTRRKPVNVT